MTDKPGFTEMQERIKHLEKKLADQQAEQEKLREEKNWLSQILQEISIPTFAINDKHILTHVNKAYENLTGISADEILQTDRQWLPFYESERPTMADLMADGASEEEVARSYSGKINRSAVNQNGYEAENLFSNLRTGEKWLFFTASPLIDAKGKVIGAVETLQDVTEQKQAKDNLQKSEKLMRTLLDFIPYPIAVFTLDGRVFYLNPAFTETFGWTFAELEGKTIPYTPPEVQEETGVMIQKLLKEKIVLRHETRRLTKDGRILDVIMRAGIYSEAEGEHGGELVILRDITKEKKIARNNEAVFRISTALPEYPDLEDLMQYVCIEIKQLLNTESAHIALLDEEKQELYYSGAVYDDTAAQEKSRRMRFPMNRSIAGKVVRTGRPIIVPDTSKEPLFYRGVDTKIGVHTRNLVDVPLRSGDRILGVLCARNKKEGAFDQTDVELLSMISGAVAPSIENARFSEDIKEAYRTNAALLRISRALPKYPDLDKLLDFVSSEVKQLIETEGALVVLADEKRKELSFIGASYDDQTTQKRVKEMKFPIDKLVAGEVVKTGNPIIVSDATGDSELHRERDKILGYHTRNLLLVPLTSKDRIIGVLCAINKKKGDFDQKQVELLSMVAGTVALSIENARYSEELKTAIKEVTSMNRAKDKVINHLSHELKTPVSVLSGSMNILEKKMASLPDEKWKITMARSRRNLDRIIEIQNQVEDIIRDRHYMIHNLLSVILSQCADELEALLAEEFGEGPYLNMIRKRIDEFFGPKEMEPQQVFLNSFVEERMVVLQTLFSHRHVNIITHIEPVPAICIPVDPLQKVVDGLIKNAIENTPDEGKIELSVKKVDSGVELMVHDYGVGIIEDAKRRIFEGFFTTQDTMDYSSKRVFDFNAGGKGADLLRMKIFSERYGFKIDMKSTRCRFIPTEKDACPGQISQCNFCSTNEDCHQSGGTAFHIFFPAISEIEGPGKEDG